MSRMKEAALQYLGAGMNVMPIHPKTKIPCIEWTIYQKERVEPHEIDAWWMDWPNANVGIITGSISDLFVLDLDKTQAMDFAKDKGLPQTPMARTSKGIHVYFLFPSKLVGNKSDHDFGMDIRGEGGYVVAPPSVHESGKLYEWTKWHPWNCYRQRVPQWLMDWCEERTAGEGREKGWHMEILEGVTDGGRNNACASLAGRFFNKDLSVPEITEILLMWNERNSPPLPESEIIRTVSSMGARHRRNG
jgi:hypothetical protein